MQVLILGNGYDRGSGLPTSYEQYFASVNEQYREFFTELESLLNKTVQVLKPIPHKSTITKDSDGFSIENMDEVEKRYKQPIVNYIAEVINSLMFKRFIESDCNGIVNL